MRATGTEPVTGTDDPGALLAGLAVDVHLELDRLATLATLIDGHPVRVAALIPLVTGTLASVRAQFTLALDGNRWAAENARALLDGQLGALDAPPSATDLTVPAELLDGLARLARTARQLRVTCA